MPSKSGEFSEKIPLMDINNRILNCQPCFLDENTGKVYTVQIPNKSLTGLRASVIKTIEDLESIPKTEGNYWIMTNEPVNHCLHAGINYSKKLPSGYQIVYNGITGGLRGRAKEHLLRKDIKASFGSQSGISIDILQIAPTTKSSHVKTVWGKKRKIPKILVNGSYIRPKTKEDMIKGLHIDTNELSFITDKDEIYFRNGIDVRKEKHTPYNWIYVFAPISNGNLRDHIEIKWRELHGTPVLCTYKKGR